MENQELESLRSSTNLVHLGKSMSWNHPLGGHESHWGDTVPTPTWGTRVPLGGHEWSGAWETRVVGYPQLVYRTTNTDTGVGIGMKIKENLLSNSKGYD